MAPDTFDHLRFTRLEQVNSKRRKGGFGGVVKPEDPKVHAQQILDQLVESANNQRGVAGFDPRLLVKLKVEGVSPDDLETIPGIQLVCQEEKAIVVVFVDDAAKGEFHRRLQQMTQGTDPTRKDVLYAIKGVENWQRKDRLGTALGLGYETLPMDDPFSLDVELWPLERFDQRQQMSDAFVEWGREHGIAVLDKLVRETLVLLRVHATRLQAEAILEHRDVRIVDLPPRIHLDFCLAKVPLQEIAPVLTPPENAPSVAILDSGIASGHPLLGPAVKAAQSFLIGKGPHDENGHGTMVAGLALYGDVAGRIETNSFQPELWIVSGRVTDENNDCDKLIENQVVAAVESFVAQYGCRIFNLSLGDRNKPYAGGHVGPWASLLDELARVHRVLFIVSAGNFTGTEQVPKDWVRQYPEYLLDSAAKLIDPAPALNVITVGSLARQDQPRMSQRNPNDPAYRPIARPDEPSPFSRSGFSVGNAIKPELVEYGGNWYIDSHGSIEPNLKNVDLGEFSTSLEFLPGKSGNLFQAGCGTSFSTPRVAWLAGMLLKKYPNASANLLRAILVAHAHVPEATLKRLDTGNKNKDEERVLRLAGFGRPSVEAALASTEIRVTLVAEAELEENHCHFFEIPIPDDFVKTPHRRPRRITISLAHTPLVRRTRLDYKGSEFSFRLERQSSEDRLFALYKRAPAKTKQEKLKAELGNGKFRPTAQVRNNGTVQAATWRIEQTGPKWIEEKIFVVVTRTVPKWAEGKIEKEPYALTVVLEDRSREQVRLYTQIRERLRERERVRLSSGAK